MPTDTTLSPRQRAAQRATRSRINKARERRFLNYAAEMQTAPVVSDDVSAALAAVLREQGWTITPPSSR